MEAHTRKEYPDIVTKILEQGSDFEFHKIMHIFSEFSKNSDDTNSLYLDDLRLRPATEISFPASDIRRCKLTTNNKFDLQINFMGMYGSDSPIPHYFNEHVAFESEESEVLRKFIDIFCHRYYFQFHLAWKKYRPYIDVESSDYIYYLQCLSGNTISNKKSELYCGSTMGVRVRNATSLSQILCEYLDGIVVEVKEFSPRWITISSDTTLGVNNSDAPILGDNIILGESVLDLSGKVDICIGPIPISISKKLVPGSKYLSGFVNIIDKYLEPSITYDLVFEVLPSEILKNHLGVSDVVLGWSFWLGNTNNSVSTFHVSKDSIMDVTESMSEILTGDNCLVA